MQPLPQWPNGRKHHLARSRLEYVGTIGIRRGFRWGRPFVDRVFRFRGLRWGRGDDRVPHPIPSQEGSRDLDRARGRCVAGAGR